ncbi:protein of unknown function [Clostridium beijerinckii]|nr:protein of unknown function [Clostridium beijerinckii]
MENGKCVQYIILAYKIEVELNTSIEELYFLKENLKSLRANYTTLKFRAAFCFFCNYIFEHCI